MGEELRDLWIHTKMYKMGLGWLSKIHFLSSFLKMFSEGQLTLLNCVDADARCLKERGPLEKSGWANGCLKGHNSVGTIDWNYRVTRKEGRKGGWKLREMSLNFKKQLTFLLSFSWVHMLTMQLMLFLKGYNYHTPQTKSANTCRNYNS